MGGEEKMGAATFERQKVMALTGATRMNLEHWDRTGVVKPSIRTGTGTATRKLYSFRDIVQLKVAKRLRDEGISLQRVRKALAYLRKHFPEVEAPLAELRFVTNGVDLFVLTADSQELLSALSGQFVFSFALGKMIEELKGELRALVIPKEERLTVAGMSFTAVLTPDLEEGGYTVTCRERPAAITQGETEQNALDNIQDAIELCLEAEKELETREKAHFA